MTHLSAFISGKCRVFASLLFVSLTTDSPPAQKPASVPGGSGAGLVANPSYSESFLTCAHCGHRCNPLIDEFAGSPAWDCPDCGFLNLLDSVPGGSGAGLVANPSVKALCCSSDWSAHDGTFLDGSSQILDFCDTLPATMTGDAWESAARHVLAMRGQS